MIKAVCIDFFGVVFPDVLNEWRHAHQIEDKSRVHDISVEADLGQINTEEFFVRLGEVAGTSAAQVRVEFAEFENPRPHVIDLIARLGAHHHVVLVSNAPSDYLREHLAAYDLEKLYDGVLISAELGKMKPDPAVYEEALRRADVSPDETVFFDDRVSNIEAAEALGIHGILFESVAQMERDLRELGVKF